MKTALAAALAASLALLSAADVAHALTAQQEKMKTCNADATAKHLNGDARKQFMSSCLKDGAASGDTALTPQQAKMKSCNTDATAKHLTGDARKQFMSTCLKGG